MPEAKAFTTWMSADWGEPAALLRAVTSGFDPTATLAVHRGNGFIILFGRAVAVSVVWPRAASVHR